MFQLFTSKVLDFIQQIRNKTRVLSRTFVNVLCASGTLTARALQGLRASPKGAACLIAAVIGISLSIAEPVDNEAIKAPIKTISLDSYAKQILTHKTYKCFRALAFRESSWDGTDNSPSFKARNGSHYGFMQGRSIHLKDASADRQFWWSFKYVAHRYGFTRYDEPNYCGALAHSKKRGWH